MENNYPKTSAQEMAEWEKLARDAQKSSNEKSSTGLESTLTVIGALTIILGIIAGIATFVQADSPSGFIIIGSCLVSGLLLCLLSKISSTLLSIKDSHAVLLHAIFKLNKKLDNIQKSQS